jgi:RNA polymerase sigma-70 factor, ECF subfamily
MSPVVAAATRVSPPLDPELEAIFREHSRLVYRTAYSVTGCAAEAEDVVQTLFLRLLRRGLPAEFARNPKGYLYRAAVNLALNALKAREKGASAGDPADFDVASPEADPAASERLRLERRLVRAMARLNPRAVEMLVLRYRHNQSEKEIAALLGTSRGVVAVTLFRARARLKKLLREGVEPS